MPAERTLDRGAQIRSWQVELRQQLLGEGQGMVEGMAGSPGSDGRWRFSGNDRGKRVMIWNTRAHGDHP